MWMHPCNVSFRGYLSRMLFSTLRAGSTAFGGSRSGGSSWRTDWHKWAKVNQWKSEIIGVSTVQEPPLAPPCLEGHHILKAEHAAKHRWKQWNLGHLVGRPIAIIQFLLGNHTSYNGSQWSPETQWAGSNCHISTENHEGKWNNGARKTHFLCAWTALLKFFREALFFSDERDQYDVVWYDMIW